MHRHQGRWVRVGWGSRVANPRHPVPRLSLVVAVACLLLACQRDEKVDPPGSGSGPLEPAAPTATGDPVDPGEEKEIRNVASALAAIEKQNVTQTTVDGYAERLATLRSGRAIRE